MTETDCLVSEDIRIALNRTCSKVKPKRRTVFEGRTNMKYGEDSEVPSGYSKASCVFGGWRKV